MPRYRVTLQRPQGLGCQILSANVAAENLADAARLAILQLLACAWPALNDLMPAGRERAAGTVRVYASQADFLARQDASTWTCELQEEPLSRDFNLADLVVMGQIVAPIPPARGRDDRGPDACPA